jgi:ribosomal protein S18 acetylase RimI-like enzyme
MKGDAPESAWAMARRLEERALNASGAFQSLIYDGWLLGYRPGPTKRLRCVNPFYASVLAIDEKIAHCVAFYTAAKLPAIFRLLPFSEPPALDGWLERAGWAAFERTLVLRANLTDQPAPARDAVEILDAVAWMPLVAPLLGTSADALPHAVERARSYPLPHAGAVIRRDDEVLACGLLKLEDDHAGLFAVTTAPDWRGRGLGRAVVAALLTEARRRGAAIAYLQVTADNASALSLYRRFNFSASYEYWYRARAGDQR